jgi:hypothetical protein
LSFLHEQSTHVLHNTAIWPNFSFYPNLQRALGRPEFDFDRLNIGGYWGYQVDCGVMLDKIPNAMQITPFA